MLLRDLTLHNNTQLEVRSEKNLRTHLKIFNHIATLIERDRWPFMNMQTRKIPQLLLYELGQLSN